MVLESSDEEGQFVLGPVTLPAVPAVPSPKCAKAKEGPVALALLMEESGGRWSAELGGSARACRDLRGLVGQHGQMHPARGGSVKVVGLGVFRGWRAVGSNAAHGQTHAMIAAAQKFHSRRSGSLFLEHELLAAVSLPPDCAMADKLACRAGRPACTSYAIAEVLSELRDTAAFHTKGACAGRTESVSSVLRRWEGTFRVSPSACLGWPCAPALASALASGLWYGDVSVKHRRTLVPESNLAPSAPSAGLLRRLLSNAVGPVGPPAMGGGCTRQGVDLLGQAERVSPRLPPVACHTGGAGRQTGAQPEHGP